MKRTMQMKTELRHAPVAASNKGTEAAKAQIEGHCLVPGRGQILV